MTLKKTIPYMTATPKAATSHRYSSLVLYDRAMIISAFILLALGVLMVYSSSVMISDKLYNQPFHYLWRQLIYLGVGLGCAAWIIRTPIDFWQRWSWVFLSGSLFLLVLVLIPGIGHEVNGSRRWLGFSFFGGQVSEFAKLAFIIYLSSYLVRHGEETKIHWIGFVKPLIILLMFAGLLLLEPDFGSTTVLVATALGVLFLSGVPLGPLLLLVFSAIGSLSLLLMSSPYRKARLTGFLDPWANQFDSGYQLTQSLIAFGRGGWSGVGLGESVQKLFYLPEAHTDFLFAVLSEELGLIGALCVIVLFAILVWRAFRTGFQAAQEQKWFSAYLAYGIGLWLGLQALINMGVNCGVLPTKGLTLPLMSYGGSSLVVSCMAIALLFRIDREARLAYFCISPGQNKRRSASKG